MNFKTTITTLAAAAAVAIPALVAPAAQADTTCAPQSGTASITATAQQQTVNTGAAENYSYTLCYASTPDHYTVQVDQVTTDDAGDITSETPVTPATSTSLTGQDSPISGTGTYTASTAGTYMVIVKYYSQGNSMAEATGQAVWTVDAPAPPTTTTTTTTTPTTPVEPVTPVGTPTTTTTVIVEPPTTTPVTSTTTDTTSTTIETTTVKQPTTTATTTKTTPVKTTPAKQPTVTPQGRTHVAKLHLVKTALTPVVKPGADARYRLTVTDTAKYAATKVQVCDTLPAGMQYVTASRSVNFHGDRACFNVGTLRSHRSAKISLTLKVAADQKAGKIINHATATAANAKSVKAQAPIRVPATTKARVTAPVTG